MTKPVTRSISEGLAKVSPQNQDGKYFFHDQTLELKGEQKIIRDNQTGISFDRLFGAYLISAFDIMVTDPYSRLPYQLRNFKEFATLLSAQINPETELKLHLVTNNNEE